MINRNLNIGWVFATGFVLVAVPCLLAGDRPSLKEMRQILASEGIGEAIDYIDDVERDHLRLDLIRGLLQEAKLSDKQLASLVDAVDEFGSDAFRVQGYQQILGKKNVGPHTLEAILDDVEEVKSAAMRGEVLHRLLNLEHGEHLDQLFEEVSDLKGDAHKVGLFMQAVKTFSTKQLMEANLLENLNDFKNTHMGFDVLNRLVDKHSLKENEIEQVLEVAENLSKSNHQLLSQFLIKLSKKGVPGKTFFQVTGDIDSDILKVSVLLPVLDQYASPKTVARVVACVNEVKSPQSKTEILLRAVDVTTSTDIWIDELVVAIGEIGQELQSCRVYSKILKKKLGNEQLNLIIKEVPHTVTSDYNRSALLIEASRQSKPDENFFNSVEQFSSSYEKGRVLRSVLERHNLDDEQLETMIRVCMTISSDNEKYKTLHALLQKHEISASLEDIFEEAIESLDKAHYRKILERALHP